MYDEDERKARNEKIAEAINAKHEAKKALLDARIREHESADLLYDQKAQIILDRDESGKPTLQGTDAEKEACIWRMTEPARKANVARQIEMAKAQIASEKATDDLDFLYRSGW